MNKKVSIITPCYNGERYVARFLDSILAQTYGNVELILINDGSLDRTEEIVLAYRKKFEARGYHFIYIKQENAGQSEAINKGLSIFTGDYMTWLDSDDYLPPVALESKVKYLEDNPTVGLVVCKTQAVDFETKASLYLMQRNCIGDEDVLWRDLILGENVYYAPGGYMVRSSMFRNAMPKPIRIQAPREIGQNYQLLIPIAYKYPYGLLDEVLYYYTVRSNSHSHAKHTFEEMLHINVVADSVLRNIMLDIEEDGVRRKCIEMAIIERFWTMHLNLLFRYGKKMGLYDAIKNLKSVGVYRWQHQKLVFKILCHEAYALFRFVKRTIKRLISFRDKKFLCRNLIFHTYV